MSEHITQSIIVKAPVDRVYRYWENFENFPAFMQNIKSVRKTGLRASHWVMEGPLGIDLEWDAETTLLEPNTRIAWNGAAGDVKTSGQVTFTQLGREETQITVILYYVPPAGLAGDLVAKLFGNPEKKLEEDLRNFKKQIEDMPERTSPRE
ncbi:MAG TPA: SRPBCC family protein [Anaerolineaceae bacterium]|nr:SRPBCC family protein [Anaerolineaceae bacterium]